MLTTELWLKVGIPYGKGNIRNIPFARGEVLPIIYVSSGNVIGKGFKNAQSIINEMEVGDLFRDAIQNGSLKVQRLSDGDSMTLYDASRSGKKIFATMIFWVVRPNGVSRRASLIMCPTQVISFQHTVIGGENIEFIKFGFESSHARIEYGTNLQLVLERESRKWISDAASAVVGSVSGL